MLPFMSKLVDILEIEWCCQDLISLKQHFSGLTLSDHVSRYLLEIHTIAHDIEFLVVIFLLKHVPINMSVLAVSDSSSRGTVA